MPGRKRTARPDSLPSPRRKGSGRSDRLCAESKLESNKPGQDKKHTVYQGNVERGASGLRPLVMIEHLEILEVRKLLQISRDAYLVLAGRRRGVPREVIQLLQTLDRDHSVAARVDLGPRDGVNDRRAVGVLLRGGLLGIDDLEGRSSVLEAREHGGGLDQRDVGVQGRREAIARGAHYDIAIQSMFPDMITLIRIA